MDSESPTQEAKPIRTEIAEIAKAEARYRKFMVVAVAVAIGMLVAFGGALLLLRDTQQQLEREIGCRAEIIEEIDVARGDFQEADAEVEQVLLDGILAALEDPPAAERITEARRMLPALDARRDETQRLYLEAIALRDQTTEICGGENPVQIDRPAPG